MIALLISFASGKTDSMGLAEEISTTLDLQLVDTIRGHIETPRPSSAQSTKKKQFRCHDKERP
jgi:hypothetical protein